MTYRGPENFRVFRVLRVILVESLDLRVIIYQQTTQIGGKIKEALAFRLSTYVELAKIRSHREMTETLYIV